MIEYILDEKDFKKENRTKPIKYIITENECWECISHQTPNFGYPIFKRNKKKYAGHRYVYELYNDEIPKGLIVRHKCDNPKCINPDHLILGTQKDNVKDMVDRNRTTKGRKHSQQTKEKMSKSHKGKEAWNKNLKLTGEEKQKISKGMIGKNRKHSINLYIYAKDLLLDNISTRKVSEITGISWASIKDFRNGKSWANKEISWNGVN